MTDLEHEIAKLLPCDGSMGKCDTHAVGSAQGWNGHWHDCPASHRPAILAFVERKIAEEREAAYLLGYRAGYDDGNHKRPHWGPDSD